jgi:hypothetical protein
MQVAGRRKRAGCDVRERGHRRGVLPTHQTQTWVYKQSPPATGTIIGHLTGLVIWDSSKTLLLQPAAIRNISLSARCKDSICCWA